MFYTKLNTFRRLLSSRSGGGVPLYEACCLIALTLFKVENSAKLPAQLKNVVSNKMLTFAIFS